MTWETDQQFEAKRLSDVNRNSDGSYTVTFDDGWSFGVPADSPVTPRVGDSVRLYGKGIGYTVRGLVIEGTVVSYRTPEQEEQRHREWCEQRKRDQKRRFEENKAKLDAQFDALPEPFRNRIQHFRLANPDFRWEYEAYEIFVCQQAVLIAENLGNATAIDEWRELPWEEQHQLYPGISLDHSGNTFGCACYLAKAYLLVPEMVAEISGALSPLVGTADYSKPDDETKR